MTIQAVSILARLDPAKCRVDAAERLRRPLEEREVDGCLAAGLGVIADVTHLGRSAGAPDTLPALHILVDLMPAVLEELRELARGIYPPVLEAEGLAAALRGQLARVSPSVAIESDAIDRYPSEIEAAIYFCCVEALQDVAGPAAVRLGGHDGGVDFSISGCGPLDGRLQRMEDRVEALGGTLQFAGGTLGGTIPLGVPLYPAATSR